MSQQIVFDTETTGLEIDQGDRVIQFAAVKIIDGIVKDGKSWTINPQGKQVSLGSYYIHGISNAELEDKPLFSDIYPEILEFIDGSQIGLAHNSTFDVNFLKNECGLYNLPIIFGDNGRIPAEDTIRKAKKLFPQQKVGLDALCKRLNIYVGNKRDKHDALIDCELLADVWIKMCALENEAKQSGSLFDLLLVTPDEETQRSALPVRLIS
jgi:DNA polymerase III subunit epsilon